MCGRSGKEMGCRVRVGRLIDLNQEPFQTEHFKLASS